MRWPFVPCLRLAMGIRWSMLLQHQTHRHTHTHTHTHAQSDRATERTARKRQLDLRNKIYHGRFAPERPARPAATTDARTWRLFSAIACERSGNIAERDADRMAGAAAADTGLGLGSEYAAATYTPWVKKKQDTKLLAITSLIIIRFSKFFTSRLCSKFATNSSSKYSTTL